MDLRERIEQVLSRIAAAAERAGRNPGGITLIAVTKVFPASAIREGYELGLRDFGENYLQEFESKYPEVKELSGARFHLIGHLQSNKAKRAAELFQVIQTVDTEKLARRLDAAGKPLDVMLEVKLSPEQRKKLTFKQGDVLKMTPEDFKDVDVVTLYLLPEVNRRLAPVLKKGLKKGARIVSHDFDMGDWKEDKKEEVTVDRSHTIYLWTIKKE